MQPRNHPGAVVAVVACTAAALVVGTFGTTAAIASTSETTSTSAVVGSSPTATPSSTGVAQTPTSVPTPSSSPSSSSPSSSSSSSSGSSSTGSASADATGPADATGAADPSLAEMNRAGDHTMGSTVPGNTATRATGLHARQLSANSAAVPGTDGLDVSGWQPNSGINWSQVYAKGARFAYIKATENTTYKSSQFTAQWNSAGAANIIRGAYHFAVPNASSGTTQANYFVSNGGGWSADGRTLPPLLDIEYNPYAGGTCYGLTPTAMVQWISDFSNTVRARTGVRPAIYSTTDWWKTCTGNSSAFGSTNPLFIARYPNNLASGAGTLPAGWAKYTMWQYASSGVFPGDQDVFNGSLGELQTFARAGGGSASVTQTRASLGLGETLGAGQGLVSPNKQYVAAMQADGNFVQTGNGRALWSTKTNAWSGARLTFRTDGELVVLTPDGRPLWKAFTSGSGADNVVITSDGDLQVRKGTTVVWHDNRPGSNSMTPVTTLSGGQYLLSTSGKQQAILQPDGNFVIYSSGRAVWATNTSRFPGSSYVLQKDGNFVLYRPDGSVIKASNTANRGVTKMVLQDDGNLLMYAGSTIVWETHTSGK